MQTAQTQLENKSLTTTFVGSTLPPSPHLPCSPSPSLSCYSCHLLYNSCQKPLDSAPRDTHTQRVATPVGQGVCAHPPPPSPSLAMVYPFPFVRLLIPFVKCFLRYYYYVCLPICRLGLAHKLPARHRLAVHKSASEHN